MLVVLNRRAVCPLEVLRLQEYAPGQATGQPHPLGTYRKVVRDLLVARVDEGVGLKGRHGNLKRSKKGVVGRVSLLIHGGIYRYSSRVRSFRSRRLTCVE